MFNHRSQKVSDRKTEESRGAPYQTLREVDTDGKLFGGDGKIYPLDIPLGEIPPFLPNNGRDVVDRVVAINGIRTDAARHAGDLQALANTGAAVIGLRNATRGTALDTLEFFQDRRGRAPSRPAKAVATLIEEALSNNMELHLVGHSQGAQIISRALQVVWEELCARTHGDREKANLRLASLKIETYGGGAARYIDGPQYVHVDNTLDPVHQLLGLGRLREKYSQEASPGAGAVIHKFRVVDTDIPRFVSEGINGEADLTRVIDRLVHGPRDIYFPRRIPFAEARRVKDI